MTSFRSKAIAVGAVAAVVGAFLALGGTATSARSEAAPVRFAEADLFVETNATDGDAGLQLALDGEAWARVAIDGPDGRRLLEIDTRGTLAGYGLTSLSFESSEPPFDEHPLARFTALFPEGVYRFTGVTVEGEELRGSSRLTHVFPAAPRVSAPRPGAVLPRDDAVVLWQRVNRPSGVKIVSQQVIVSAEETGAGLEVDLPASATRFTIPAELLRPGREYKVEVIAREKSGNQTITEIPFTVR